MNQNFTDIINGLSDGTKDISVSGGTFAGNVSFNGNTSIGNSSGDELTITASLASSIPIKTTNSYDIGSSTIGLRALYYGANSKIIKTQASSSMSADWTWTWPVTAGTDGYYLKTNGSGVTSWQEFTPPTIQKFTSGSGTYTTPANVKYIRVRMVGGGGGGGGGGTGSQTAGGAGGNTTFGNQLSANGAPAQVGSNAGGSGGTATLGTGPIGTSISGGDGKGSVFPILGTYWQGGSGGNSPFFSGGGSCIQYNTAGQNGTTNTGGGGAGGGVDNSSTAYPGAGGGSGGFVEAIISPVSSTYSYAVGAAGAAGAAGTSGKAGGSGASGYIEVTEYYS